jgi:1-acyl-sn-glycerol-3-phosphate acyltransferase
VRRAYYLALFYASWLVFGLVGLILNLFCLPLLLLPRRRRPGRQTRALIRFLFDWWLRWLHMSRVADVHWHGFEGRVLAPGTIYVANHPSLMDATFLLARLPDAICIFKPALMKNPAIGPAAIMAEYASGISGVDVIRYAAEQVQAGCSLLIFPEGTRTGADRLIGQCKPGFALIAERAQAPVRLITIQTSGDLCTRERPWWRAPVVLPSRVDITLGEQWLPDPVRRAHELTAIVQQQFETSLAKSPA